MPEVVGTAIRGFRGTVTGRPFPGAGGRREAAGENKEAKWGRRKAAGGRRKAAGGRT